MIRPVARFEDKALFRPGDWSFSVFGGLDWKLRASDWPAFSGIYFPLPGMGTRLRFSTVVSRQSCESVKNLHE